MNKMIDKRLLGYYICQNQIAWQKWDGLIEVAHGIGSPSYENLKDLWKDLPDSFNIVSRNEMLDTNFANLAKWSTEDDVLILAGDGMLLCIPKFEYEKLVA